MQYMFLSCCTSSQSIHFLWYAFSSFQNTHNYVNYVERDRVKRGAGQQFSGEPLRFQLEL
uniref:Uncharacterized protein n=1 Tax=Helianthus annuus TaxID=4232 RepID=A0A251UZ85_HELAN